MQMAIRQGLVDLGFSVREARTAVLAARRYVGLDTPLPELLREALRHTPKPVSS